MKCPNEACGFVSQDSVCPKCETVTISESLTDAVIICNGKLENGSTCCAEIKPKHKFCGYCGTPVNQQLFANKQDCCWNCGAPLASEMLYCSECGQKKKMPMIASGDTFTQTTEMETSRSAEISQISIFGSLTDDHHDDNKDVLSAREDVNEPVNENTNKALNNANDSTVSTALKKDRVNILNTCKHILANSMTEETVDVIRDSQADNMNLVPEDYSAQSMMQGTDSVQINSPEITSINAKIGQENVKINKQLCVNCDKKEKEVTKSNNDNTENSHLENVNQDQLQVVDSKKCQTNEINTDEHISENSLTKDVSNETRHSQARKSNILSEENFRQSSVQGQDTMHINAQERDTGNAATRPDDLVIDEAHDGHCEKKENEDIDEIRKNDCLRNVNDGQCQVGAGMLPLVRRRKKKKKKKTKKEEKALKPFGASSIFENESHPPKNLDNNENEKDGQCQVGAGMLPLVRRRKKKKKKKKKSKKEEQALKPFGASSIFENESHSPKNLDSNEKNEKDIDTANVADCDKEHREPVFGGAMEYVHQKCDQDTRNNIARTNLCEFNNTQQNTMTSGDIMQSRNDTNNCNLDHSDLVKQHNQEEHQQNKLKDEHQMQDKLKGLQDEKNVSSNRNHQQNSTGRKVQVLFHVLVSEDFHFKHDEDKLLIRFGNDALGGWNDNKVCTYVAVRQWDKVHKVHEMMYDVEIPKQLINGHSIEYKYVIMKQKSKNKEYKYLWEHYHKNYQTGKDANRTLTIPAQFKMVDKWHQYDGFIESKTSGLHWVKGLIFGKGDRIEQAVQIFCTKLLQAESKEFVLIDVLDQLQCVFVGLKRMYFTDQNCASDEAIFKLKVGNCIVDIILKEIERLQETTEYLDKQQQKEKRICLAVGAVCVANYLNMPVVHDAMEQWQKLCKFLLINSDMNKQCTELQIVEMYITENHRQDLNNAFLSLCQKIAGTTKNPCWLYLMPWVHFLFKSNLPYDKPPYDIKHDADKPVWWGIDNIGKDSVESFKGKTRDWFIPIPDVLKELEPLFEIDYLLPRTFMAAVQLKELPALVVMGKIPTEILIATVSYYLKKTRPSYDHRYGFGHETSKEKIVKECLNRLVKCFEDKIESHSHHAQQAQMIFEIAFQLLKESCNTNRTKTMIYCSHILLHSASSLMMKNSSNKENQEATEVYKCITVSANMVVQNCFNLWHQWNIYMQEVLMDWNEIFALPTVPHDMLRTKWNMHIKESLMLVLDQEICRNSSSCMVSKYIDIYCQKMDLFNPIMQECLSNAAIRGITQGFEIEYGSFSTDARKRFGKLLSERFTREWSLHVKEDSDPAFAISILEFCLNWPPFQLMITIHTNDKTKLKPFTDDCAERIIAAESVILNFIQTLCDGSITISNLYSIAANIDAFVEIAELVHINKGYAKAVIRQWIDVRLKEVDTFNNQAQQVGLFVALCVHLHTHVDRCAVDDVLERSQHKDKLRVDQICIPTDVFEDGDVAELKPKLCAFKLSPHVLNMLPVLQACNESSTFSHMWVEHCKKTNFNPHMTLEDVVQQVWFPVYKKWESFSKDVTNGNVKFSDFDGYVGQRFRNNLEGLKVELQKLRLNENIIELRLNQLEKHWQLECCIAGAQEILQFAEKFHLNGDFKQIKLIAAHGGKDLQMNLFNDSIMETCKLLMAFTLQRVQCLGAFVKCKNLVDWIKELIGKSMHKSGLKEFKVFIDLAFMSAGDEPISIAKVQCLHAAVTGYAPLIFDLQEDTDGKKLLELCSIVWLELNANPKLPKQLIGTSEQLSWFQDIQKAHGSVEVTSLMQAADINDSGIYTVGNIARDNDSKDTKHIHLELGDCIQLIAKNKAQRKNYTFSQLQDLHSRLMLVAGKAEKGNDSVRIFTMIFDGVTRISNVFVKLCSSGCVLFKDWKAQFICDAKDKISVCVILEFGHDDHLSKLMGRRSTEEPLEAILPALAKFMESCLEEWLHHIQKIRRTYYQLNYFTIDQLVILQRELVKIGTDQDVSHLIYPLLSAVKHNCTPGDLVQAMKEAKSAVNKTDNIEESEVDSLELTTVDMIVEETEDRKRQIFVQALINAGYDKHLATRALEYIDCENVDEGIIWCMDHHGDYVENVSEIEIVTAHGNTGEEQNTIPAFCRWSHSDTSIQSMITSNIKALNPQSAVGITPLLKDLTTLWKQFLESVSSSIQDYLSLEHLGLILRCLARKDTTAINRSMPPGFVEGQPNLIVCPSADVLNTTISIYYMDKSDIQPLPCSDEVLMCHKRTTKDEVEIFWRRAIFDDWGKVYCLVHADLLAFDVSDAAARCLQEHLQEMKSNNIKYRLVIICGSDNEYRSAIVASLDKYKRQPIPIKLEVLRKYVHSRLVAVTSAGNPLNPAADIDHERLTVRVVKSWRAGVGKTLYKKRKEEALVRLNRKANVSVSIPLQEKHVDLEYVTQRLLEHTTQPGQMAARLFHIDISYEVQDGVDYLLFNLLILGCLMDSTGYVWRKSPSDLYIIETMPLMIQSANKWVPEQQYVHKMLNILPDLTCRSPQECLDLYDLRKRKPKGFKQYDQLFDENEFKSDVFQRPFQYLLILDEHTEMEIKEQEMCLKVLLRHCGIHNPSWAELHHFVWFLNTQLADFEQSNFVSNAAARHLPGFSTFVLRCLIQMSRDFSTRSLNMSEESPGLHHLAGDTMNDDGAEDEDDILVAYKMRRTWESSPHPYLFFNSDGSTFTFLGFYIDKATGNLIDQKSGIVLEQGIMSPKLYDSLVRNRAPMQEDFDNLPRAQKILKMCNVMGIDMPYDPDDTYELTTDNVKKILAIYMRFRCDIPVIIMGETGCGKTRLVKFMCALQSPPGLEVQNMILMKVHGGTTNKDILAKVQRAEQIAQENIKEFGEHMYTVLFFDEANTTESIGLIKEIMCDKSMEGKSLKLCKNLKIVAACNPYKKHSEELIKKLEQSGLGYHVDAEETTDRLGRVPMRRLVYRVQPLPQSLLPLVWDFGQLNIVIEDLYIRQMVRRYIHDGKLPRKLGLVEALSAVITASQEYMRHQKDECSFVSLRDVDRVLHVMSWFYEQSNRSGTLFDLMDDALFEETDESSDNETFETADMEEDEEPVIVYRGERINTITRCLILSLGVCYHACLKERNQYHEYIARYFQKPCQLQNGAEQIAAEIECCQDVFLDSVQVQLEDNIARNLALKENFFMMVMCIELRIPLFLVGKPGSSKSLAKTIVSDAMQGKTAKDDLFKELKQAQLVSFQCSPLSTPDGIVGTFRQCAQFQQEKDLDTFVSVVVLDEVGLAEDSPRMPLKTLHPMLEDGSQGDDKPEQYMKVAFIGISNWALDPAKMNRGILVQREVPDLEELIDSARGICTTDDKLVDIMEPLMKPMAESYLEVFENAAKNKREFFGLRDFYSLIKMVYSFVVKSKKEPTWHIMVHAIRRNFGGLDQVDPVQVFKKHLAPVIPFDAQPQKSDPDCSTSGLIMASLFDTYKMKSESRYLLLLTENYGALTIIQQLISSKGNLRPITIFGSSFHCDQEYTQVCRNINKIKVCMETGNTVVLLNLENLYESLYDALNQYYVCLGGERYVDLGLGTHRVKCPVHKDFRLIVIAEKQMVYKKFPIPLINRLEKHFLTINTILMPEQQKLASKLEEWVKDFVTVRNPDQYRSNERSLKTNTGDVFIGYHDDTCSAIVLHVWHIQDVEERKKAAKEILLWCATPDAVVRLKWSQLSLEEQKYLRQVYSMQQVHDSLVEYLHFKIMQEHSQQLFAQITTHSKLLASVHISDIAEATGIAPDRVLLLETLSSFDTEQQFSNKIQHHLQSAGKEPCIMVIQCDSGDINANLIASAHYCVLDEFEKIRNELKAPAHVVFIVQLPRGAGFTGFQCGMWQSVHIDDIYKADETVLKLKEIYDKSIVEIISGAIAMETTGVQPRYDPGEIDENPAAYFLETDVMVQTLRPNIHASIFQSPNSEMAQIVQMETEPMYDGDILTEIGNVGQIKHLSENPCSGQSTSNVKGLILYCVQAALSMVKDKGEDKNRELDRVALLLILLGEDLSQDNQSFLNGLSKLIVKLLTEKEDKTGIHKSHNRLVEEAAENDNITKAGTFRRSCVQTLVTKVSPILAGIIAYLDTNDNLDILQNSRSTWKHVLWLQLVNSTDAIPLQYADIQSPTRKSDLKEMLVTTTGYCGHHFSARMPFSWMIYDLITEIIKNNPPDLDHMEGDKCLNHTDVWVMVLKETALGKLLDNIYKEDAVIDYMHDFIHTVYNATSNQELILVNQSIACLATKLSDGSQPCGLLHKLVHVHLAYRDLASRLAYFHSINVVWPECSLKCLEFTTTMSDHVLLQDHELIFTSLCFLIESLTPNHNELNESIKRTNWLSKVHQYRPIVEKVLGLVTEDGVDCLQSFQRAKALWSRVVVMKLFLEHVCASDEKNTIMIKHCMPFWTLLGEDVNMKEMRSLGAVEKFLKSCNKAALKEFFGTEQNCANCEVVLDGPPVTLPCEHMLCDRCVHDLLALNEHACPKCSSQFEENWRSARQSAFRKETEKIKKYQKMCNAFFMDVVSQLCFTDNSAPSDEVVNKLFTYVTCTIKAEIRTKDLTIFETGVDPNPVFRSFLLHLLMRISEERVKSNLDRYLKEAGHLIKQSKQDQKKQHVELSLLVIQCLEDILNLEAKRSNEIDFGRRVLQQASKSIEGTGLVVEKLYALASARTGLAIAARCIAEVVEQVRKVDNNVRKLIEAAQILCECNTSKWPRIFLVKYMCRCFGFHVYREICRRKIHYMRWIPINTMDTEEIEGPDRYIVCNAAYSLLRESVTKVVLGEKINHLVDTIQEIKNDDQHVEQMLQLAIHREVTCCYLYSPEKRKINDQVLQNLMKFVQDCDVLKNKTIALAMIQNQLLPHLSLDENEPPRQQGIKCLITHFMCVMSGLKGDRTLLHPLVALISQPQAYINAYFPTMPQDEIEELREALLAARHNPRIRTENPVFYRCPNGHAYIIGNCGRPAEVGTCKDCGAAIGGVGHQLTPGNMKDQGYDNTQTGHILGVAEARGQGLALERNLTPASCACIRLIMHIAMYIGCGQNKKAIQTMIRHNIETDNVEMFLWNHIVRDVDDVHQAVGRSIEDVLILMHSIVDCIMKRHHEGEIVNAETSSWSTKNGRKDWETKFAEKYVQTKLQDLENILKTNNHKIAQDQRLGANPLLCLLYETEGQTEEESPEMLLDIARVWRFRTPISVDHLRQEFETWQSGQCGGIKQHKMLQLFLKEDHHLRALRYIPSILQLHQALFHKYQKKLDKAEASNICVDQLIKEEVAGPHTAMLLEDFAKAWKLVRESLKQYVCPTSLGAMVVSKEYCSRSLHEKTTLSELLPTTNEAGLCSYALLDFLMRKQNDFLDKYFKESGRKSASISKVLPKEVTSAHLISYDPEMDILPLLLANCHYAFEIGKGTKIDYDFESLERQLMDRFLFSKSKIDVGPVLQIDLMMYRTEITNTEVFRQLTDKIPQDVLSNAVKTQIESEIHHFPDLCQSLDNLDITISFLKTTGGKPRCNLHDFMTNTLKMNTSLHSQKARQDCQYRHVRSLWLLLSLLKSKKMCQQNRPKQAIFESVAQKFHEDLPDEVKNAFLAYLKELSVKKLSQLLEVFYEYILLVIAVHENLDDENYTDTINNKLTEWLSEYMRTMDKPPIDIAIMAEFPAEILYKHCVHAWIIAEMMLRNKLNRKAEL